jgi:hypothetical protein
VTFSRPEFDGLFEETGLGGLDDEAEIDEAEIDFDTLELDLGGVYDEVDTIRDVLGASDDLLELLEEADEPTQKLAREKLAELSSRVTELLGECLEALSRIPMPAETESVETTASGESEEVVDLDEIAPSVGAAQPEEEVLEAEETGALPVSSPPDAPAVGAGADPARPAPEPVVTEAKTASGPPSIPGAASPPAATPARKDATDASAAEPAQKAEPGSPQPPAPSKGLALVEEPKGPAVSGGKAQEPAAEDEAYKHRAEDEALKALQEFYNAHSPSGSLQKPHEPEFTRMVKQLLGIVKPDASFGDQDFSKRYRHLKDTMAFRKKLNNALTLPEFEAFFR